MQLREPITMKKRLLSSYISGINDHSQGERCATILRYFFPEFITSLLIYSLLYLVDARFIAELRSTAIYATVGTTNTMLHFLVKIAEGFSIGTVVMVGTYNGVHQFKKAGKALVSAFWMTIIAGGIVAVCLYGGAFWILDGYGLPLKMIEQGVPFLKLRSISIFLMFVYFALVGFLRGIKRPQQAMYIFLAGGAVFLFFDYVLIFGKLGFPALGVLGSAWAAIIQHIVMLVLAIVYIAYDKTIRVYAISLGSCLLDKEYLKELWQLSWPVMLDKGILAAAYLWLGAMINPMGKYAIASYTVIKDLERVAILPAAAFAQVITYLVSNAYGKGDWQGIKTTIKKTVFLSSLFVFAILLVFSLWPNYFIAIFDLKNKFTTFSAQVFPFLSILVFFDLLQLVLSGALRGAQNVRTVMYVRLAVCLGYFVPVSWFLAHMLWQSMIVKFVVVYGSFYIGNALMSIIYIHRFRGELWKKPTLKG